MQSVLILGAGLVSKPMVDYLLERGCHVHIASRTVSKADALIQNHKNGKATAWLVEDTESLKKMVNDSDIVVSLLPYTYHLQVAEICLEYKKHLITTSYVKEEMQNLDKRAREAGILILNEIGLDPGIDHMSAMQTIDSVKEKGGKIISFRSLCGALPSPEASNNPLRYKFGWSPRGVALAGRNPGKYKENGKVVNVSADELFKHNFPVEVPVIGQMEVYPNRDSLPYANIYSIPDVETIFRGTFRYQKWCELWYVISNLGFLDAEEKEFGDQSYREYTKNVTSFKSDNLKGEIAKKFDLPANSDILSRLEWLGLFSDEPIKVRKGGNVDVLVDRLTEKCSYERNERDMVILQDETIAEFENKKVKYLSTLLDYGKISEATSVARTVSLPAACAVRLLLNGKINLTGVHIPVLPEIYEPVLKELATLNIECKEEETVL